MKRYRGSGTLACSLLAGARDVAVVASRRACDTCAKALNKFLAGMRPAYFYVAPRDLSCLECRVFTDRLIYSANYALLLRN